MSRVLAFWLALLLIFSGGMLLWMAKGNKQADVEPVRSTGPKLTAFELIDQTGVRVNSQDMLGKVWTGSFFFCSCPSTCYNQNMKIAELQSEFVPKGLTSFSITCDPSNDNPAALARYASRFNADSRVWKFLTPFDGDMNYIQRIGNDYFGVMVGPETHTDRVMVIDRQGKIRGSFSVLQPEQFKKLRELIAQLLAEKPEDATNEAAEPSGDPADESLAA